MEGFDANALASRFTWIDYCVFSTMLVASAAIGLYYGCVGKGMKDTKEFLLAGKSMTTLPISMSLMASFISAITILGMPSEVYQNGFVYWLIGFGYFAIPMTAYIYLPVFWELQVTSSFEYLEMRFNKATRRLASFMFILLMNLYMSIAIYAPALALSQVTGIHVYVSVSLISVVGVFYTTLGGMKAVLWTDVLQLSVMIGSALLIIIKGTIDVGGFQHVWQVSTEGGRTTLVDFDPDPRKRHTFWGLTFGALFHWFSIFGVNQTQVQRCLSSRKKSMAVRSLWISWFGFFAIMLLASYGGLLVYTKYVTCDPISAKLVSKPDQLFPLFVMDHFGHWKGLPGVFVAGVFSGALSTVSSGINSLSAITLEDFVRPLHSTISERLATTYSKVLSLAYGIISFLLVLLAEQLGDVLVGSYIATSIIHGPLLGIFSLGMLFPWTNSKGAFIGTIGGLSLSAWVSIGHQISVKSGAIPPNPTLSVSTSNCTSFFNETGGIAISEEFSTLINESILPETQTVDSLGEGGVLTFLYQLSYLWYGPIGCLSTIIFGLAISFFTGKQKIGKLNPKLLSPVVFLFKRIHPGVDDIGKDFIEDQSISCPSGKDPSLQLVS